MDENIEIFCCYAQKDRSLLLKLRTHLSLLEREGFLHIWHDGKISPGTEWEEEINKHLNTAHIILLLISPDFMASEYCYSKEMKRAMERHECGEALVIPVLLRPVLWQGALFGKLQVLPDNAQPVTTWRNRDEALLAVAQRIEQVVKEWFMKRPNGLQISSQMPDKGSTNASNQLSPPSAATESDMSLVANQLPEKLKKVDIAIITIRKDEFEALYRRFRPIPNREPGRRTYGICHVKTKNGCNYTIAIARCSEQGNDTSQKLANDMIHDLNPQLILVVGIAGGVPHDEFTLGDVIVSTRIHNLNVGAQHEDGTSSFDIRGGIHPLISDITSNLLLYRNQLADWNQPGSIGQARPGVSLQRTTVSGDEAWRRKVRASLKLHFGIETNRTRLPLFETGSIASSNHLIRNPLILKQWSEIARKILAVEMETAGVYEAAQQIDRQYPVMAIRGISDIVGLKREAQWTVYACETAAAFTYAFIMTEPIAPQNAHVLLNEIDISKYLASLSEYSSVEIPSISLEVSLPLIFQPLKLVRDPQVAEDRSREERRSLLDEGDNKSIDPQDIIAEDGIDALHKSPRRRLAILGGPGSGKTTLLKYLVRYQAEKARKDPEEPVPIFIPLSALANFDMKIEPYFVEMLQKMMVDIRCAEVLVSAIDRGKAFVCLDGWDEIPPEKQREMTTLINVWASRGDSAWIISSRFAEYQSGRFASRQFSEWELLPLRREQCQRLAQSLFAAYPQRGSRGKAVLGPLEFVERLGADSKIAAWQENPLLFTLAIVTYLRTGTLPSTRIELFEEVVSAILKNRESDLGRRGMTHWVMTAVALELYYQRKGRTFTLSDLLSLLQKINKDQYGTWNTEEMIRRLINSGLLEVVARETYGFLHQTFQEYLAAQHINSLTDLEAKQEVSRLAEYVDEPFCLQVIVNLAYLTHHRRNDLEDYLYHTLITDLGTSKMELLKAQREGRPGPTRGTAVSWGITYVLQHLVDLWEDRLSGSLQTGSPDSEEAREIASTIGSVFERYPRQTATQALIESMYKYKKRARFIGTLRKIGTKEAIEALIRFGQTQAMSDLGVLDYLVDALGEDCKELPIPLLQAVEEGERYNESARDKARRALDMLGQPRKVEERKYDPLQALLSTLEAVNPEGWLADWQRIEEGLKRLRHPDQRQFVEAYQTEILAALEKALNHHKHDGALEPIIETLAELGNAQTFDVLLRMLVENSHLSFNVARKIFSALVHLAEKKQIDPTKRGWLATMFSHIRLAYPALVEEINATELRIQSILAEGDQRNDGEKT